MPSSSPPLRLPFFYGWVVVAVAFVTMAVSVNARTAFSLLYPPILDEFGWQRGETAGAFTIGFLAATGFAPLFGVLMDRAGPRVVIPMGATIVAAGFVAATWIATPVMLYLSLGLMVVGASVGMSYIGHSMFLPNWFVRRRGLAIGIAFAGVGVGAIVLLPATQGYIETAGWRAACLAIAIAIAVVVIPLNAFLQRRAPADVGLEPDGGAQRLKDGTTAKPVDTVVDRAWAETEWTLPKALATGRFWWISAGYFAGLFAWYSVQVHQTRYLLDIGFGATEAAFALGLVGLFGIGGQIGVGALSDRIGREWGWTIACLGFAVSYLALIALGDSPTHWLVYVMVVGQGLAGYGLASLFGAVPAEIFAGRRFATIFSMMTVCGNIGAGVGPWITGVIYDATGSYNPAFLLCLAMSLVSAACIWAAAPRRVRLVAGQAARRARAAGSAA
ncbi:MFS transporter [Microbaculum marinisediminis]|uniref:MFS transporter n=1 Tax=Microbaculum marinisediminis TaxID=2931392 RepID=A0AAW5R059_9HYPH|nr:MFS transporter [Microbaculum sp. A6E488]MCT8972539.1 MFS transporter [Microbaculum sp. A6E488]